MTSWPLPLPMRDMVSRAVAQSAEDMVTVSCLCGRWRELGVPRVLSRWEIGRLEDDDTGP